jgi:hypothetical protein
MEDGFNWLRIVSIGRLNISMAAEELVILLISSLVKCKQFYEYS